ncbi:hypothetical protein [uncultured Bradyrhizobium sp.]|uniref:hypothetical protein n=1 Tax=Bradyrhizobium sp. TaxID=376 RepID=UPI00261729D2|nr:hypothetical protein [uncultured Bradyrhizobium sp.]
MLGNWFRRKGGAVEPGPFYRPYRDDAANQIYNLLFCDNISLLNQQSKQGDLGAVLSDNIDRETLDRIGNDLDVESRTRVLAFNRLRAMKASVPRKRLLGTIVEMPLHGGIDTLAIYLDHRLRYINHTGKMAIFESTPSPLSAGVDDVLSASQFVVNRYGPWDRVRKAPPTGDLTRMTFLVSDGLYFGEGHASDLLRDRFAAPVLSAVGRLMPLLVDEALRINRSKS